MNFNLNYKSLATVIVWVVIVAGACYYFYEEELKIAQMAPKILAARGMSAEELSYVYEADLSDIYDMESNKSEDDISKAIFVYMYEDRQKGSWGRVIIYERSSASFKYIIKTNLGDKLSGEAIYSHKDNYFSNNDYEEGQELSGCQVILNIVSTDKVKYQLKDKINKDERGCSYYRSSAGNTGEFFTNIIHRKL